MAADVNIFNRLEAKRMQRVRNRLPLWIEDPAARDDM
jgi:hypothetical protein